MTKQKTFKRRVRERMSRTGERYSVARSQVVSKRDRVQTAHARLAATDDRPSDEKVRAATGKKWDAWFSTLDRWGARERGHQESVAFLMDEHHVPGWWAQAVTVWYERARGMRLKHQQVDGFTIYASKTIAVPVDALFEAFTNARTRRKWLIDGGMRLRTAQPSTTARFDWADGTTRVLVTFERKDPSKATVSVAHARLPDPDAAETTKTYWRERLAELKSLLERPRPGRTRQVPL